MTNSMTEYILKHSRKKDKELKYDFMPSMLEIIERPAHKGGTIIIIGIFTLIIAAIIWTCLSRVDVVVTANGSLRPIGDLSVVKSYSGGVIEEILVSDGQYVEKGDTLIKMNTNSIEIDTQKNNTQIEVVNTQIEFYNKILNGEDVTNISLELYSNESKSYIRSIIETEKSYLNTLEDLELDKSTADLNKQIAQLRLEEYINAGIESQEKSQELIVQQYEVAYKKADVTIRDTRVQHDQKINSSISSLNQQLTELKTNLEKYKLNKAYQQIISPINGYVNSIGVNTKGDVVTTAQELVTIVPEDSEVEMVCYVKNMDIADIKVGDETAIKLEAYPYSKYGTISGIITYISPSSFTNEQLGSVYMIKIKPDNNNDTIDMISGLTGIVEIKTGMRSIMDYFLEPIIKGFDESLKEK
ncbi:MAG: HlyD family efflux transporter periplasmic adaptor subunit [Clostridiales bacterium]|nr:HlyD family efflux transporter periplasmic adaptor subunit [Clostridiales bacterium]